jgi:hypothetical protein
VGTSHHRVYAALGLEVRDSKLDLWGKLDNKKEWRKDYSERPDVRHKMALTRHSKLMEELKKEKEENLKWRQYASGAVAPMGGGESSNKGEKVPSLTAICSYCHNKGHKTKKSRLCLFSTSPISMCHLLCFVPSTRRRYVPCNIFVCVLFVFARSQY